MPSEHNKFTPEERIRKARSQLLEKQPFFGYLSLRLSLKSMSKELKKGAEAIGSIPTICVDYRGNLYYDEDFISTLSDTELQAVVSHETMHLAFSHNQRFKAKPDNTKRKCWNIATDIVINDILIENSFDVKKESLSSKMDQFTQYKGKASEEIYRDLLSKQKVLQINGCGGFINSDGQSNQELQERMGRSEGDFEGDKRRFQGKDGKGEKDESPESSSSTEDELKKLKEEWDSAILEAAEIAHRKGKLTGSLEKYVDLKLLPEKVDWRRHLFRFIQRSLPQDFTWSRPSKKSVSTGVYLPSILRENLEIIVTLDVSGSIDDYLYVDFINEIIAISHAFNRVKFTIISADAEVKHILETHSSSEILDTLPKRKGYGGTDFRPAFEWALENVQNCRAFIYFTDGQGTFPDVEDIGDFIVLWIYAGSYQAKDDPSFGEIIRIEPENGNGQNG